MYDEMVHENTTGHFKFKGGEQLYNKALHWFIAAQ